MCVHIIYTHTNGGDMIITKITATTAASKERVWDILKDVEGWIKWDHSLESSEILGPFREGTTGSLTLKDGTKLKTVLTKVVSHEEFVQEARLVLAKAKMSHFIKQEGGKTTVIFQTEIKGPLAFFYKLFIGAGIKKKIPKEMNEMIKLAENI
jgi:hypothetical protein